MAKEILVGQFLTNEMIEAGQTLVNRVRRSELQVVAAFWLYFEEAEEWRLVLASSRLNKDGPLALYNELSELIHADTELKYRIRLVNTTFVSSDAKLVRALATVNERLGTLAGKRFTRTYFNGEYVEDIYVYFVSGNVHSLDTPAWMVGDNPLDRDHKG